VREHLKVVGLLLALTLTGYLLVPVLARDWAPAKPKPVPIDAWMAGSGYLRGRPGDDPVANWTEPFIYCPSIDRCGAAADYPEHPPVYVLVRGGSAVVQLVDVHWPDAGSGQAICFRFGGVLVPGHPWVDAVRQVAEQARQTIEADVAQQGFAVSVAGAVVPMGEWNCLYSGTAILWDGNLPTAWPMLVAMLFNQPTAAAVGPARAGGTR
jgi:hypothetical protein